MWNVMEIKSTTQNLNAINTIKCNFKYRVLIMRIKIVSESAQEPLAMKFAYFAHKRNRIRMVNSQGNSVWRKLWRSFSPTYLSKQGQLLSNLTVKSHIQLTSGNLQEWRLQSLLWKTVAIFYHSHVKRFFFIANWNSFVCCFFLFLLSTNPLYGKKTN